MTSKLIRTGFAITALVAATLTANAADLRTPSYKAPSYVAPSYGNWSGFYLGVNFGYGFGKSNWDVPVVSPSPKGALFGVTAGYNLQTGTWVWGLEGDIDWSGVKDSVACGAGNCETSNTWLSTARARIGYAGWNNFMPYLTGGAAFGNVKATNSAVGSASSTRLGYALGAGFEYALWSNWSVKLEYLYADLGKFDCAASCGAAIDNVSFKTNLIRAGVNYRF
jgi:outer membrane immunogenic protein